MNKQQKDYLCTRIDQLARLAQEHLDEDAKYSIPPLTPSEIIDGVRSGLYSLKPNDRLYQEGFRRVNWVSFKDAVDLSDSQRYGVIHADYQKRQHSIVREAQRLKDEVILADTTVALQRLREFEATYLPVDTEE